MATTTNAQPAEKMLIKERLLFAALLLIQIPAAIVFFPLACVLVLTGILAPIGMMAFSIGSWPLSTALVRAKRRNQ